MNALKNPEPGMPDIANGGFAAANFAIKKMSISGISSTVCKSIHFQKTNALAAFARLRSKIQ